MSMLNRVGHGFHRNLNWLPLAALVSLVPLASAGCRGDDGGGNDSNGNDESAGTNEVGGDDGSYPLECIPGEVQCKDGNTLEVCSDTGLEWEDLPCGEFQMCVPCMEDGETECEAPAVCTGPCDIHPDDAASAGCSFLANRMLHSYEGAVDGLIIGNPSEETSATVQLFRVQEGTNQEEAVGDPFLLEPLKSHVFELDNSFIQGTSSLLRNGGNYRVQSNIPIIAYQHSPLANEHRNDASMLLPEAALGNDYVVSSYNPRVNLESNIDLRPSYLTVIAAENDTLVSWTPPVDTAGNGVPINFVNAGETGEQLLNRFDMMRIAADRGEDATTEEARTQDVSGTVLHANKPIWVVGAAVCSYVPGDTHGCDHLQELMIPLRYWGTRYVGPHSPTRSDESHIWRVYAADADVTVTTDPPQPGTPFTLDKRGDWEEFVFDSGVNVVWEGDGAFMPVQYLTGQEDITLDEERKGDPAMYQMVPTEQYLSRYVFVTGKGYNEHYAQVIRTVGNAAVFVDGDEVTDWTVVGAGDYEVATVVLDTPPADPPGEENVPAAPHVAVSDDAFGLLQVGYSSEGGGFGSYAYPGGMRAQVIYVP